MDNLESIQMEDHALLMELVEEKRRQEKTARIFRIIMYIIVALIIIGIISLIPIVKHVYDLYINTMNSVNQLTGQVDGILRTYSGTFEKISEIDLGEIQRAIQKCNEFFAFFSAFFGG